MTWDELEQQLIATLRRVSERVFLIVSSRDASRAYVQFAGGEDSISAEASGFFPITPAADDLLEEAGWVRPGPGQPNWSFELPVPAMTIDLAALARRCITALRDAYRIDSPERLQYRAWRDPELARGADDSADGLWNELDKGEDPLEFTPLNITQHRTD